MHAGSRTPTPLIATCHCGGTRIEVALPPTELTACNCSFCSKRGGLWVYYARDDVVVHAAVHRASYSSDRMQHVHYHCARCGCSTHSDLLCSWTDDGPDFSQPRVCINARLFDGLDMAALPLVELDGRNQW
jgi:hypothetical protein